MPRGSKATVYPWGTVTPRERLRALSEKLRSAMQAAQAPGFRDIPERVQGVVHATRPLVDTLDYLAGAGLRPTHRGNAAAGLPVACVAVFSAVESANDCLGALVSSTIHDASERYLAFIEACEALLEFADRAIQCGIAGGGAVPSGDPWKAFDL